MVYALIASSAGIRRNSGRHCTWLSTTSTFQNVNLGAAQFLRRKVDLENSLSKYKAILSGFRSYRTVWALFFACDMVAKHLVFTGRRLVTDFSCRFNSVS